MQSTENEGPSRLRKSVDTGICYQECARPMPSSSGHEECLPLSIFQSQLFPSTRDVPPPIRLFNFIPNEVVLHKSIVSGSNWTAVVLLTTSQKVQVYATPEDTNAFSLVWETDKRLGAGVQILRCHGVSLSDIRAGILILAISKESQSLLVHMYAMDVSKHDDWFLSETVFKLIPLPLSVEHSVCLSSSLTVVDADDNHRLSGVILSIGLYFQLFVSVNQLSEPTIRSFSPIVDSSYDFVDLPTVFGDGGSLLKSLAYCVSSNMDGALRILNISANKSVHLRVPGRPLKPILAVDVSGSVLFTILLKNELTISVAVILYNSDGHQPQAPTLAVVGDSQPQTAWTLCVPDSSNMLSQMIGNLSIVKGGSLRTSIWSVSRLTELTGGDRCSDPNASETFTMEDVHIGPGAVIFVQLPLSGAPVLCPNPNRRILFYDLY